MKTTFETVYLSNADESMVSKWDCEIELSGQNISSLDLTNNVFVLPPLNCPLEIIIRIGLENDDLVPNKQDFIPFPNEEFWTTDLNYAMTHKTNSNKEMELSLKCNQFTTMKADKLFYKPISLHLTKEYKVLVLSKLTINGEFYSLGSLDNSTVQDHLNEYFISLIISQLEFQFPLVFSRNSRRKFLNHEQTMGAVSCSLAGNNSLISNISEMIAHDLTSSFVFEVLEICANSSRKAKYKKLGISKLAHKPFKRF
ncbi:Rec102p Ecym_7347 [Eremothecium cymbalariae DBVPG|uniref:Uncharacterized protein n=1 Tax=Eremothecium cymbalariae (strain CBS 270.75 / DBVPG 7215 / KCTC 17166 / NRRL Y-17582) TaxID=931890 RepID=G8JWG1_ERECY|nr:hypothetical protein Ecym_7347 [Eremothecium cymbalariae DBVPG\